MKRGALLAAAGYIIWGFLPVYWKALKTVPALQILAHRMVWSLGFVLLLLLFRRQLGQLWRNLHNWRILATYTTSALLLGLNWYLYIWAVNSNHVVESSLGYFINPLISVLLGMLFLRERLRPIQGIAIGLATLGVLYLTFALGKLPWIALVLAVTFGTYGLIRKTAALDSLQGLTLETLVLFPLALGYLLFAHQQGIGAFGNQAWSITALLVGAGVVTATPLLFFAAGARQISMTMLGLLQYIAPTLQFLIGVFMYGEAITSSKLIGFMIIWAALILYTIESYLRARQRANALNLANEMPAK